MIWSVVFKGFRSLRRDRGAMVLAFILPVAFFTIFAAVFGGMGGGTPKVKVAVVDLDHSEISHRLLRALLREPSLDARTVPVAKPGAPATVPYTAAAAEAAVKAGDVPAAVLIPKGFGLNPVAYGASKNRPVFTILHDKSDPVAAQMVSGLLQKAVMMSMPDVMAQQGGKYMDSAVGGLTPDQKVRFDANMQRYRAHLKAQEKSPAKATVSDNGGGEAGLVAVTVRDVVGEKHSSMISFYAAGIGVMFLLFTASGAAGSLIDESESGALDRMLSAGVSMTTLLAGKMLYCTLLAFLQMCVMFVWGALVFRLELWSHIPGFVVMTAATAFAVASFGMLLASLSRTRQQQGSLSTLLVLAMSALGGSMFPRFLMPVALQNVGLFTFNAWAIDGFTKVFWRDEPVWHLLPQVGVLIGAGIALFLLSRVFARRWEYV